MRELSPLQAAAQRKHAAAVERATVALSALAAEGATITFQQVARRAGVPLVTFDAGIVTLAGGNGVELLRR